MSRTQKNEPVSLEQMQALLKLLHDKRVGREQLAEILSSGILADVCDAEASLKGRYAVRTALGMPNFHISEIARIVIGDIKNLSLMGVANYPNHWDNEELLAKQTMARYEVSRGTYECMHIGASLDTKTNLSTLEQVAKEELVGGKWQRAHEVHLTACISAFHHQGKWLPRHLLAPDARAELKYDTEKCFYFVNSYGGMVSPWRRAHLWDIDQELRDMKVLYVRKLL